MPIQAEKPIQGEKPIKAEKPIQAEMPIKAEMPIQALKVLAMKKLHRDINLFPKPITAPELA